MERKKLEIRYNVILNVAILVIASQIIFLTLVIAQEQPAEDIYEMTLEELMNVKVVTAIKLEQNILEAPATIAVITAKQIYERGYEDLNDILRDLPGIDFVHVQGTFPTIWAPRGLYGDENKRTLLLIDGIEENNILEGNVLSGPQYSVHNIERIEVIWGPGSALWGANAFSGIINIITRKGSDINGVEYQKGFGSYQTAYDKFIMGGEKNGVEFSLSGSLYNSDGPVFKERHPNYNNSYVDNAYSLIGRLRYKATTFGFSRFDRPMGDGQFSNSPAVEAYGLPSYGFLENEGANGGMAQSDINGEKGSLWHSYTQTTFLKSDYRINDKLSFLSKIFHRISGIAEDSYEYDWRYGQFHRDPYSHSSSLYGGEGQVTYTINANQDFIAGVQYDRSNVERGYRTTFEIDSVFHFLVDERNFDIWRNYAVYSQYRLKSQFLWASSYILGIRYDNNNVYGSTMNPRIGIIINPNEKLTVKALYGSAFREPNSFELFTETNVRIPNPDLKSEKAKSYEINTACKLSKNVFLEGSIFYNYFADIIVSNVDIGDVDSDGESEFQNRNQGTATVTGFELKTTAKLNTKFLYFANFSFQDATQRNDTLTFDVPNIANFKSNIGINYLFADLLTINLIGNWVGNRTTAPTNPDNKINGYFITHLSITTTNLFDKFKASVVINNVFDSVYEDPGIRGATGGYYGTRHLQPGRSAFVKLIYKLGKPGY